MHQLKNLQIIQIGMSCLICTGVWSNLFVNIEKNKPLPKESKPIPDDYNPPYVPC